jgi:hypothetical protein
VGACPRSPPTPAAAAAAAAARAAGANPLFPLRRAPARHQAKKEVVVEPDCPAPSPRVNASLVPYTTPKATELILFGGEYTDLVSGKVLVNADLYRFDCDKAKWTRIRAPSRCGAPPRRCRAPRRRNKERTRRALDPPAAPQKGAVSLNT